MATDQCISRRFLIDLAILVAAIAGCGAPKQAATPQAPPEDGISIKTGQPAPELGLETILQAPPGAKTDLAALRGKVVVLEFWATWCGPCIIAIPHMNEMAEAYQDQPVQFIAVTDQKEEEIQAFLKKRPIRGWVGLDVDRSLFKAYEITGIPHTVLIDKNGNVAAQTYPGAVTKEVLANMVAGRKPGLPVWAVEPEQVAATPSAEKEEPPLYEVSIRPRPKERGPAGATTSSRGYRKYDGTTLTWLISTAFDIPATRISAEPPLPSDLYDVLVIVKDRRDDAIRGLVQSMLETTFGLSFRTEPRKMDACHLKVAPGELKEGFRPTASTGGAGFQGGLKELQGANCPPGELARLLESRLKLPIIDETGLKGGYDFELTVESWEVADVNTALRAQLGLELVPVKEAVEVLVVEQADPAKK